VTQLSDYGTMGKVPVQYKVLTVMWYQKTKVVN